MTNRTLARATVGALLFGLIALLPGMPASAAESSGQFAEIEFDLPNGVPFSAGSPVVAAVSLETTRPISGTLVVVDEGEDGGRSTWEYDLDLAANSQVQVPLTLSAGWSGVRAEAVFLSDGQELATEQLREFPGDGVQSDGLVALLGIDDPPRRVLETATDRRMATLSIDENLRGLDLASSVVAAPGAIAELAADPKAYGALRAWVRGGGQLVVAGQPGSVADLEEQPTANPNRFESGVGSVVYREEWRESIPFGGYVGISGLRSLANSQGLASGSGGELAIVAGLSLPSALVVGGLLAVYALVAGPVLFGVAQGRNRPRLVWFALPALSVLATVTVLAVGSLSRRGEGDAHITVVEVADENSRATSFQLVSSSFGGEATVEPPEGWVFLGQERTRAPRDLRLRPNGQQTTVAADLPPGGYAVLSFAGQEASYDGALTIDIKPGGRTDFDVEGSVTNQSSVDLTQVVAFLGHERVELGDLPAGATEEFSLTPDDSTRTMRELQIWPRADQQWLNNGEFGGEVVVGNPDSDAAVGTWTEWRLDRGPNIIGFNAVGVVGWTDELPNPLVEGGKGRTALFHRQPIGPRVSPAVHFTGAMRLPATDQGPDFIVEDGFEQEVWGSQQHRFTLGTETDIDELALHATQNAAMVKLWTADGWRYLQQLPDNGSFVFAIPPEAVVDGEVLVDVTPAGWGGPEGIALAMVPNDDADVLPLGPEESRRNVGGPGPDQRDFFGDGGQQLGIETSIEWLELAGDGGGPGSYDGATLEGVYDEYQLEMPANTEIRIALVGRGDPYLSLYRDDQLIDSDDDGGRGTNSLIVYGSGDEPESIAIRAQGLGGQSIVYELGIEVVE